MGTKHYKEGPKCFNRIAAELEAIMKRKGYSSIDDFCGKLKARDKNEKITKEPMEEGAGSSGSAMGGLNFMQALVAVLLAIIAGLLMYVSKSCVCTGMPK